MGIDNSEETITRVRKRLSTGSYDHVFHVGDISYYDDHFFDFVYTWNYFRHAIEPISSQLAYMGAPGNHDYGTPFIGSSKPFRIYNSFFQFPSPSNSSAESMYYSYNVNQIHFVVTSTETSFPDAPFDGQFGDQVQWVKNDLAEANKPENRALRPWIIVISHRPIYCSSFGYADDEGHPINWPFPPSNSKTLQKVFEDLFYESKVDLSLSGHCHLMERMYPTYRNHRVHSGPDDDHRYVNPKAPAYVVFGNAGNIENLEAEEFPWMKRPDWSAHRFGSGFGYSELKVINASYLWFGHYRSHDDGLEDYFEIVKNI